MKQKRYLAILCAAALLLSGCGASSGTLSNDKAAAPESMVEAPAEVPEMDIEYGSVSMDQNLSSTTDSSVYQRPDAKLIRRCTIEMQTTEFDAAIEALNELLEQNEGYFETSSLRGGGYYNANARRSGEYIVRIPAERYSAFRSAAGELGYVTYSDENTEDIGVKYYDTEARLLTLRTKQDRLLALLEKAETMEDIITLESALSEVEYEIELHASTLNRYDGLVSYATFTIYVNEVKRVEEVTGDADTLADRMADGFRSGLEDLQENAEDFLVWLSYHFVGAVIFVVVAGGAVILIRRRKLRLPRFGRKNKRGEEAGE